MDRDLGEISDMKESQFNGGLCYQWGRKEPFSINCKTVSAENDLSKSGYKLLSYVNCTIENTIANPMAFVQMPVQGDGDWCPGSPSSEKRNLWDSKKQSMIHALSVGEFQMVVETEFGLQPLALSILLIHPYGIQQIKLKA